MIAHRFPDVGFASVTYRPTRRRVDPGGWLPNPSGRVDPRSDGEIHMPTKPRPPPPQPPRPPAPPPPMDSLLKLVAFILVIWMVLGGVTGAMDPDSDVGAVGLSLGFIFFGGVLGWRLLRRW